MKKDDYLLESQKLLLVLKRVIDHDFDTWKLNFVWKHKGQTFVLKSKKKILPWVSTYL